MSELRTRFEKLRNRETLFEADGFRFVLFGSLVNGTNVDEIIKPLPRDFLIPDTTKPDLELLVSHFYCNLYFLIVPFLPTENSLPEANHGPDRGSVHRPDNDPLAETHLQR